MSTTSTLGTILTVARKELLDFLRDRKTLLMTLLVGPVIMLTMFTVMGKLADMRMKTELERPLSIPIVGAEHAPNLVEFLASQGIRNDEAAPPDIDEAIRSQRYDVALVIDGTFAEEWNAGKPARVEVVTDSTRRTAEIPLGRVNTALTAYSQQVGMLRLLARGVSPAITQAVGVDRRDLATPEARRGLLAAMLLPLLLLMFAFVGGAHLSMDTTAGERERQSLEPLLATPATRAALVSGKMLAASLVGIAGLLIMLLTLKGSAAFVTVGFIRALDMSFATMAGLLLVLLPLVLLGTAALTLLAAGSKSMKEAQANMTWMMFLPMFPVYALMVYPIRDTDLWQYAVPFLSQNQMVGKLSRGELPAPEQWGVYLVCAFGLAAIVWAAAVWRYGQEKLAISA
ncbi:MAG: ABC transporter permease [Pseudoxanthomonas suwonensis]|nr:ABC transporter permease [Pseudoxanthomonas suwonensis]